MLSLKTLRKVIKEEPTTKLGFKPKEIKGKYRNLENYWSQNPLVLPALDSIRTAVCGY